MEKAPPTPEQEHRRIPSNSNAIEVATGALMPVHQAPEVQLQPQPPAFHLQPSPPGIQLMPEEEASTVTAKKPLSKEASPPIHQAPANTIQRFTMKEPSRKDRERNILAHFGLKAPATGVTFEDHLKANLSPDDLWVAERILAGKLGDSVKGSGPTAKKKPIKVFLIKGKSSKKAMVIAGVHGSEVQGIEVAQRLVNDLQANQPHYTTVIVPTLFPHNADARKREGRNPTNRDFPAGGTSDLKQVKLEENKLLIQLMDKFNPARIISVHGTWRANAAGVFSDPTYISKQRDIEIRQQSAIIAGLAAAMNPLSFMSTYQTTFNATVKQLTADAQKRADQQTETDRLLAIATAKKVEELVELQQLFNTIAAAMMPIPMKAPDFKKEMSGRAGLSKAQKKTPSTPGNELENPTFLSHIWSTDRNEPAWKNTSLAIKKHKVELAKHSVATKTKLMEDLMKGKPTTTYDAKLVTAMTEIHKEYLKSVDALRKANKAKKKTDAISLGNYAPGKGMSVFTVEPGINKNSGDYGTTKDPSVTKATREVELQSYADAIREVLLGDT